MIEFRIFSNFFNLAITKIGKNWEEEHWLLVLRFLAAQQK